MPCVTAVLAFPGYTGRDPWAPRAPKAGVGKGLRVGGTWNRPTSPPASPSTPHGLRVTWDKFSVFLLTSSSPSVAHWTEALSPQERGGLPYHSCQLERISLVYFYARFAPTQSGHLGTFRLESPPSWCLQPGRGPAIGNCDRGEAIEWHREHLNELTHTGPKQRALSSLGDTNRCVYVCVFSFYLGERA